MDVCNHIINLYLFIEAIANLDYCGRERCPESVQILQNLRIKIDQTNK